jgi:SAM-dependent methyltransferase
LKQHRFYHCIDLGNGVITAGIPRLIPQQQLTLRQLRRFDFAGKRVLDIGCRDGLFSFEAERLGAAEVIGIDNCISPGAVEVVIPHLQSKVRMYEMNLLDMTPETFGRFDIIICGGDPQETGIIRRLGGTYQLTPLGARRDGMNGFANFVRSGRCPRMDEGWLVY